MNKLEFLDKENNSILYNQNGEKSKTPKGKKDNIYLQSLLSELKISNTINIKKKVIDNLITTFKNNNDLITFSETKSFLLNIYQLLQKSILDNNNIPFIISQLTLIDLLMDYLNKDKTFILFFKRILSKLFDKFYLNNENINKRLLSLFNKSIVEHLLSINDYYSYIETITLEGDNNYIINVLKFFYFQIKNDNNFRYETIPLSIINIIKQKYEEKKCFINDMNDND